MKQLDLNIKLKEDIKSGVYNLDDKDKNLKEPELISKWIGLLIERSINKPDPRTGRPTINVSMDVQRKYFKIMDALETNKKGIAEFQDDDFSFLDKKINQAEIAVQKHSSEIIVKIGNAINKAKVNKK